MSEPDPYLPLKAPSGSRRADYLRQPAARTRGRLDHAAVFAHCLPDATPPESEGTMMIQASALTGTAPLLKLASCSSSAKASRGCAWAVS
jgi:hypothetical protein